MAPFEIRSTEFLTAKVDLAAETPCFWLQVYNICVSPLFALSVIFLKDLHKSKNNLQGDMRVK